MAEVGVLNLTIKDNASSSKKSLDNLAGALRDVRAAVGEDGFGLSKASQEINKFAKSIGQAKYTMSVMKTLSEFSKQYNQLANLKDISFSNKTKSSLSSLKDAIGDGLHIGQAGTQLAKLKATLSEGWNIPDGVTDGIKNIRNAMSGEINSASVLNSLKELKSTVSDYGKSNVAGKLNNVADAIRNVANAYRDLSSALGKSTGGALENVRAGSVIPLNLQQFGRKKKQVPGQTQMNLDNIGQERVVIDSYVSKAEEAINVSKEFVIRADEVKDKITSIGVEAFKEQTSTGGTAGLLASINNLFKTKADTSNGVTDALDAVNDAADKSSASVKRLKQEIDSLFTGSFSEFIYNAGWFGGNSMALGAGSQPLGLPAGQSPMLLGSGDEYKEQIENLKEYLEYVKEVYNYTTAPTGHGMWSDISGGINEANSAAQTFYHTMERTNEIIRNMSWSAGNMAEQFKNAFYAWSDMRSSFSLGSGNSMRLGSGATSSSTEWTNFNPYGGTAETGWTYWKDGAIEAEGTVSDAYGNIEKTIEASDQLFLESGTQVFSSIEDVAKFLGVSVEDAKKQAQETYEWATKLNQQQNYTPVFHSVEEAAKALGISVEEVKQKAQETYEWLYGKTSVKPQLVQDIKEANKAFREAAIERGKEAQQQRIEATRAAFGDSSDAVKRVVAQYLNMSPDELFGNSASAASEAAGKINVFGSSMSDASGKVSKLRSMLETLKNAFSNLTGSTETLKDGVKKMFPTLSGLAKRFGNLVKYRMLRAVISHISKGFTEGVQNVYQYSKAVGTSLAPAMDSASSAFALFKNSIGAAVAPLIQAFIPVINQVISVVVTVINYLNQFFALLGGQATWTRALPQTTAAFDKQKKAAGGAGKAMKDLLADWDELNIIQSQSGGGGGGGAASTAKDYLNMFEEVNKFDSQVKSLVDGIKEQFGDVLGLVKRIGIGLLGWKISNAFGGVLGFLGGLLAGAAIVDLVFNITTLLDKQYFKTGNIGFVVADVLQTALGAFLANKVASKVISKGAGKVSAGIVLAVSAVADVIALAGSTDVSALSEEGIITSIKSGLKLGAGFYLFSKAAGVASLTALSAAGTAASLGIAASIAITAISDAVQTGDITFDTVKAGVASAVAGLLGVTVFEMIGGATFGAAIATGGMAALVIGAGFAVALGAVAMINRDNVKWGGIHLTDEDVQKYVEQEMFNVNIPATINIMEDSLTAIRDDKAEIERKLSGMLGTLRVVKLGIAKSEDYTDLAKEILGDGLDGSGGLVGQVSKYISDAEDMGKLTLEFTPSLVGTDAKDASEWFTNYTSGWDKVNEFVKSKGAEIGKLLTTEEGQEIIRNKPQVLSALMQQLNDVTNAITSAHLSSEAFAGLSMSMDELLMDNFDKASVNKVLELYDEYLGNIRTEEEKLVKEQYIKQGELVAGLIAIGSDPEKEPLKSALDDYKKMGENLKQAVEDGVKKVSEPGRKLIRETLQRMFHIDEKDLHVSSGYASSAEGFGTGVVAQALASVKKAIDEGKGIEDVKNALNTFLGEVLSAQYGKDYTDYLKPQLESGVVSYTDFFGEDMLNRILANISDDGMKDKIREAWNSLIKDALGEQTETPEVKKTIDIDTTYNQTAQVVTDTVEDATGGIEEIAGGSEAVEQYKADAMELESTAAEVERTVNTLTLDDLQFDPSGAINGANTAASAFEDMAARIRNAFENLNGLDFSVGMSPLGFMLNTFFPTAFRASGGPIRSGDLVMANENGNIEMMGRMGNQPVVANNQQIVQGISSGVAQANGDVVGELRTLTGLMQRMLQKEFVAKAVPGSGWARMNDTSNAAYSNISGNA